MTIDEFISARLDEADHELHDMTSGALVQGYLRAHGDQLKAQIAAMRKILSAHVGYYGLMDDEYLPVPVLSILAGVWKDHEDYGLIGAVA
ncbi:hypothetical protein ACIBEJ_34945 [Nonomuraea sp. NPDC050790]|uniref:hypothetical protein n=1 Tax=Nonomuraea sp. NPDC050790 TaxID=3364371 RepID=UPI0037966991